MNKLTLATAIAQLLSGLVLVGLSIYYIVIQDINKFIIFLLVGIVFIVLPIRTFFRVRNQSKDDKKDPPKKGGFL